MNGREENQIKREGGGGGGGGVPELKATAQQSTQSPSSLLDSFHLCRYQDMCRL